MKGIVNGRSSLVRIILVCSLSLAFILLGLVLFMPGGASEEYKYTVQMIFQFGFPVLILCAIVCFLLWSRGGGLGKRVNSKFFLVILVIMLIIGTILVYIPVYSPPVSAVDWEFGIFYSLCWFLGSLMLAGGLFMLATCVNDLLSGALCFVASVILAFSVCELGFLVTSQTIDGRFVDNVHSKYAQAGEAVPELPVDDTPIGISPRRPDTPEGAYAHREMRYDQILFDVKYSFNERNHRIMPAADDHPKADLLTFGCSFTFGYGLEDDQTWPYKLARLLGPSWKVENYAYNGFGVQQMLGLLEENLIEPPTAPVRQAIFLGINDQVRRNSGLFYLDSITYRMEDGRLVRGPRTFASKLMALHKLPEFFNGSQFVREICRVLAYKLASLSRSKNIELYTSMLIQSAKLLRDHYQTVLTVLLWPDLEDIAPRLQEHGIPVLFAREMLKNWGQGDSPNYHIVPHLESHPNDQATTEIARWLAEYYAKMAQ